MFVRLITEPVRFAWLTIVNNRLRTFLSLLGVTIGIIAIISVFTIVDALEKNVRDSVESLGDNVVYIQKWPWGGAGEYQWWKYYKRPKVNFKEFKQVNDRCKSASAIAFLFEGRRTVKSDNTILEDVKVSGFTFEFPQILSFNMDKGRFLSQDEMNSGKNYVLIGHAIATALFENFNPIGESIKIAGINAKVIGVIEKQGEDITGNSQDNSVLCSYLFAKRFLSERRSEPLIMVKANENVSNDQLKSELKQIMRTIRRVRPLEDDNFSMNEVSLIKQGLDQLFSVIGMAGWIIGGFSILVGGFGIANIMFVSVKERTKIIGIQKALGAKNIFILLQFLFESIFLCVLGGSFGLTIVWVLSAIGSKILDFNLNLTIENIILGLSVSAIIGMISGIIPALSASKLDPVDAIRSS
ncbi:MAG: ABC transporter permease [Bacteroidota bacterium]|nr:ABC transporter permease [Bacteroidota bacterium]